MEPLKAYVEECRGTSRERFCLAHPNPFLVYSVVRGGDLKPAGVSSGLTIDRLRLETEVRKAVGGSPVDWYVVFEVRPGRDPSRATIGCSPERDVHLDDLSVSRHHATIERRASLYFLVDEDSSAGTSVGGTLLEPHAPAALASGVRLGLGNVDVVFQLPGDFYDFVRRVGG